MPDSFNFPEQIVPVDKPTQFDEVQLPETDFELVQASDLIQVSEARRRFAVSGKGLSAAVLDTGLNDEHVDFAGRTPAQRNFTGDNGGSPDNAKDGNGHGTNVAGIIAANADHVGVAPEANIIPLKVLGNNGSGSFTNVEKALDWVLQEHANHNISAVCMSLGDGANHKTDTSFSGMTIHTQLRQLRDKKISVVLAAGNDFFSHGSQQGMGFPAIFRESVSVGAVYDADEGGFSYGSGAQAFSTAADRITPFSQRLHGSVAPDTRTDIFAPGAPVTSSGINGKHGESVQHGTSQATPVTVGVILLLQQFFLRATGCLPRVDDVVTWLRTGGVPIRDGDDEHDNVENTGLEFVRVDALGALDAVRRHLQRRLLLSGVPLRSMAEFAEGGER